MDETTINTEIQGLTSFHVQGFKSIFDASIEPGYLNVIIGANGAGKSNLLEALGVIGAAVSGVINDESLFRRGVRLGRPAIYKSAFKGDKYRRLISLEARWKVNGTESFYRVGIDNPIDKPEKKWSYSHEKYSIDSNPIVTRSPRGARIRGEKLEPERILDKSKSLLSVLRFIEPFNDDQNLFLENLEEYSIYQPTTPILRGTQPDPTSRSPVGIYGGDLAEAISDLIYLHNKREININMFFDLIEWVKRLGINPGTPLALMTSPSVPMQKKVVRFVDKYMREGRNVLTAYDASEGALYVLFLLALIYHPNAPKIFAIDNFDSGMHPRLLVNLVRSVSDSLINNNPTHKQVFLTSHNPLVLDGLPLYDDRVRLFALDRDKKGRTTITRIEVDESLYKNKDVPLSTLWTMGVIGGVPKGF